MSKGLVKKEIEMHLSYWIVIKMKMFIRCISNSSEKQWKPANGARISMCFSLHLIHDGVHLSPMGHSAGFSLDVRVVQTELLKKTYYAFPWFLPCFFLFPFPQCYIVFGASKWSAKSQSPKYRPVGVTRSHKKTFSQLPETPCWNSSPFPSLQDDTIS